MLLRYKPDDEKCIIGCCLEGGADVALDAVETVNRDAFSNPEMLQLFNVIAGLATSGKDVNGYTVASEWNRTMQGRKLPACFHDLEDMVVRGNLPLHVAEVNEAYRVRTIVEGASEVLNDAQKPEFSADELVAKAETWIYQQEFNGAPVNDAKDGARLLIADLERRHQLQGAKTGVVTGFYDLDRLTDGLQFGEQTIIGARPSMGKTAIGLNIVQHACLHNRVPTCIVSLEMPTAALMRRLMASEIPYRMGDIRGGVYSEGDFTKFTNFSAKLNKSPLWVLDAVGGMDIDKVCASVRRLVRKHGIRLVMVDYLQKIRATGKHEKRTYEIGEVSGQLKALAVTTNVALLTLAQLNRESEKDKTPRVPRLSDLADSGQIERDADCIGLIHRDRGDYEGKTDLIIAKQRDGETGCVKLRFNGAYCRFENTTQEEE